MFVKIKCQQENNTCQSVHQGNTLREGVCRPTEAHPAQDLRVKSLGRKLREGKGEAMVVEISS